MGNKQRSVRLSDEEWEWLKSLPPRYGANVQQKLYSVLQIGIEELEKEQKWIEEGRAKEGDKSKRSADESAM